jgi:hypothetical protein
MPEFYHKPWKMSTSFRSAGEDAGNKKPVPLTGPVLDEQGICLRC